MHYAINIADLSRLIPYASPPLHPYKILITPLLTRDIVMCEKGKFDGAGIRVNNADAERWDAVYRILREGAGRLRPLRKHQLRIYESRTGKGGWRRI